MYDAQGSKLYVGDVGSPDALTQVLKVRRISDPNFQRNWKERTDLDSTWEEGKPGIPRIGEMSFECFWVPDDSAAHTTMLSAFEANTQKKFRIEWPSAAGDYVEFSGYVMGMTGVEDVDGDLVRTFTLRGTGAATFGS